MRDIEDLSRKELLALLSDCARRIPQFLDLPGQGGIDASPGP